MRLLVLPLLSLALACSASPEPPPDTPPPAVVVTEPPPAAAPEPVASAAEPDESEKPVEQVKEPEKPAESPAPSPWLAGDAAPTSVMIENNELKLPGPITFHTGKDTLTVESDPLLASVAGFLAAKPFVTLLRVEVHTDSLGNSTANQVLSQKRALSVAKALVARGVDCKRLIPVGFGETKPIADNATASGRAQNRRTAFVMAALRGKAIGGMPVDGGGVIGGDPCR